MRKQLSRLSAVSSRLSAASISHDERSKGGGRRDLVSRHRAGAGDGRRSSSRVGHARDRRRPGRAHCAARRADVLGSCRGARVPAAARSPLRRRRSRGAVPLRRVRRRRAVSGQRLRDAVRRRQNRRRVRSGAHESDADCPRARRGACPRAFARNAAAVRSTARAGRGDRPAGARSGRRERSPIVLA